MRVRKKNLECTVLSRFNSIWELSRRISAVQSTRLRLSEGVEIIRLAPGGSFPLKVASASERLVTRLASLVEKLHSDRDRQVKSMVAAFVIRYYEEACPQECLDQLVLLSERIKWLSSVKRYYSLAASNIVNAKASTAFMKALSVHIDAMKEKYSGEFSDSVFLCSRLSELCNDIFDSLNVIPSVRVACQG
ncbi:MAG: hypothetical protein ABWK01_06820 [Infirmifilum sp.]